MQARSTGVALQRVGQGYEQNDAELCDRDGERGIWVP